MAEQDFTLGADYAAAMSEIGKRFDRVDAQAHTVSQKLDEQELDLSEIRAILRQDTRETRDLRVRMGLVEVKIDAMAKQIAALQGGQVEINDKLDTVIALLTKQGES